MKKIYPLSEQVIARIAAGEVIERPVYAVKELVENALDAHADSVTVIIEDSGLKKIVVTDNGDGMSKEDIVESIKPHTTSKLIDDLIGISTLGFRGEALSSIASISQMTIQSRERVDAIGTQITVHVGEVESILPFGMPVGTTVTVENIFSSLPARKKFLKSERTEFRHILEVVIQYALSYKDVRFVLIHNDRTIIDLPKTQVYPDRLEKVLGYNFSEHLLPLIADESYIDVQGFISHPQVASSTQTKQYIFINNRVVTDKTISTAVREAYGNLLDKTQFPIFIFFLNIPYEMVDVNVHPRKEQVAFVNNTLVFDTIKNAVTQTLLSNNLTFHNVSFRQFSPRSGTTSSYASTVLKDTVEPWNVKDIGKILKKSDVGQIHNLYLTIQTKNGFLLVDQHAAHERILYEQFLEEFKNKQKLNMSKDLKKPIIIDLSFSDSELLNEYLDVFSQLGFEIEEFKGTSYRVNKIPELFIDRDITLLILDVLENIDKKIESDIDRYSDVMISYLACRSAIKAGEVLTKKEAEGLIQKLESTSHNATCPHGRPTKIEISLRELNRLFKRE